MLLPLVEVIFGEGFLNSGGQVRSLPTYRHSFRTHPKKMYGNITDDGTVEMGDWRDRGAQGLAK